MENFLSRLRKLRSEQRYSQSEIAELIGISQSYYARFETGKGEPNLEILVKLADIFDVELDYLLGRIDIDKNAPRSPRGKPTHAELDQLEKRIARLEKTYFDNKIERASD